MTTVKTVKLQDIKGKDLLYVMIENNGMKEAINVGEKTWNRIDTLINSKPGKDEKQSSSKMEK